MIENNYNKYQTHDFEHMRFLISLLLQITNHTLVYLDRSYEKIKLLQ